MKIRIWEEIFFEINVHVDNYDIDRATLVSLNIFKFITKWYQRALC